MTLLQFISIVAGFVFLLFSIDAFARKKLNLLHFLVFFGGTSIIIIFSFSQNLLNKFWSFFGLARGADLIVYISIIFLAYLYFEILNKITKDIYNLSKFVSFTAIENTFNNLSVQELVLKRKNKDPKDDFVFLIRSYNEEATIWEIIDEISGAGYSKIIVLDDGSTDNTELIIKSKKQELSWKIIIYIKHSINRWWWSANKTLFEFVRKYWKYLDSSWFVTFDADGQMDAKDLEYFLNLKEKKSQVYLGSRFMLWASVSWIPVIRRIILFWARFITFIFNWIFISDPHNGFRIISFNALQEIKIYSDNMTYASEILDEIKWKNIPYEEFPVNIRYTKYSLSKWQKNSNAIRILLEIIYRKFFFR